MLFKIYCLKQYFLKKGLIVIYCYAFQCPILTTFLNYTEVTDIFSLLHIYSIQGSRICKLCIGNKTELQVPGSTVNTP